MITLNFLSLCDLRNGGGSLLLPDPDGIRIELGLLDAAAVDGCCSTSSFWLGCLRKPGSPHLRL